MSFLARIVAWESHAPDRVAHRLDGRATTYRELLGRAKAVAQHLRASRQVHGTPIVLLGHREPEMLAGMLGCALAGHPYVPVDDATPRARVERIIQIACAAVLTPTDVERLAPCDDEECSPAAPDPRNICYVMFTSGSTGDPKGVQISYGNLDHFIDWMIAEHQFGEGADVFLNQANLSFDLSVMDVYLSLVTGGTLVSLTRDDVGNPRAMYQRLAESGITTWVSTPSFAGLCLVERSFTKAMLPQLRRFLFCGEVLPPDVAKALLDRFPGVEVWNTYGPTEATVATTSIRCTRDLLDRYAEIPVGRSMPGTRVLVCDDDGAEVAPGERGEIVIDGPNVSPGYLHQPELTGRVFSMFDGARRYRTGDWGRYRDGLLFWEGRRDQQIKLHGYRIEPGDIEAQLRLAAGVRDAAVIVQLQHGKASALVALVLCDDPPSDPRAAADALRAHLAERVPAYMVPRHIRFVVQFPLTPNGKIDRRALAASLTAPLMTAYADLLYFGVALWAVVPAVLLGLSGRLTWKWGLISTLGMLVAQYIYEPGTALRAAWPPIAVSVGFVLIEWSVAQALLRWRSRAAPWRSWLAVLLTVLPLAAFKFVPIADVRSTIGFVGISYVSFRALDVVLTVHDRLLDSLPLGQYLTYILFFPTLSAGPIDRWRRFARDVDHVLSRRDYIVLLDEATHLLFTGILYKFVLAAAVQEWWMQPVAGEHGLVAVGSYMYAYSAYLFFDFAGYSAFAMAFSRLLGVRTPENFRRPFAARNIADFWSRWHISLSSWFRDQIYMRFMVGAMKRKWFGGRRLASAVALLLTFGLMGVWHGTAWRYPVYGLYHALLLIVYDWWRQRRGPADPRANTRWRRLAATVLTVQAVCLGFLIFSGRLG